MSRTGPALRCRAASQTRDPAAPNSRIEWMGLPRSRRRSRRAAGSRPRWCAGRDPRASWPGRPATPASGLRSLPSDHALGGDRERIGPGGRVLVARSRRSRRSPLRCSACGPRRSRSRSRTFRVSCPRAPSASAGRRSETSRPRRSRPGRSSSWTSTRRSTRIAADAGQGSVGRRRAELQGLFARATEQERRFLIGLFQGEIRQGALAGVMVEAVARPRGSSRRHPARVRCSPGDLGTVAAAAIAEGHAGLSRFR